MQCVALLREIARSGRTVSAPTNPVSYKTLALTLFLALWKVITTIHQPSSRLLEMFDHLYIVAGGSCMYQGPVASLVPYLQTMNLNCPSYHNPADFGDYTFLLPFSSCFTCRRLRRVSIAALISIKKKTLGGLMIN